MRKYRILARLPWPLVYLIAGVAFNIVYHVVRYRRRVVRDNLTRAFPEKSEEEILAIELQTYRNLCETAVEVIKGARLSAREIQRRVTLENPEVMEQLNAEQQSIQLLLMHQANFEWALQKITLTTDAQVLGVYKPLHNPDIDQYILDARQRHGGKAVEFKNTMRAVLRGRKDYRWLLLAADQAPISREKRYWREFFGQLAPFYLGPQAIAEVTKTPTYFMHIRRVSRGQYSVRLEKLAEAPAERGGTQVIDAFIECAERSIREAPGDWLWSNRKWKTPKPHELGPDGQPVNPV